jgi:DNA end-binding protein Ku
MGRGQEGLTISCPGCGCKSGHFNPEEFEDHYEDALKELLKKKQAGEKIEAPRERTPTKVINLMDALR